MTLLEKIKALLAPVTPITSAYSEFEKQCKEDGLFVQRLGSSKEIYVTLEWPVCLRTGKKITRKDISQQTQHIKDLAGKAAGKYSLESEIAGPFVLAGGVLMVSVNYDYKNLCESFKW